MNDGNHDRANATGPASNGPRRNLDRRRVLKTTAGGAAGLSLAGCLETAGSVVGDDDADPVTIGVLAPNPESDATGRSIVRGAQLAVDQLKDDDGILGREVEMVVGDTNGSHRRRAASTSGSFSRRTPTSPSAFPPAKSSCRCWTRSPSKRRYISPPAPQRRWPASGSSRRTTTTSITSASGRSTGPTSQRRNSTS